MFVGRYIGWGPWKRVERVKEVVAGLVVGLVVLVWRGNGVLGVVGTSAVVFKQSIILIEVFKVAKQKGDVIFLNYCY
jgi:hypothetical protein